MECEIRLIHDARSMSSVIETHPKIVIEIHRHIVICLRTTFYYVSIVLPLLSPSISPGWENFIHKMTQTHTHEYEQHE